MSAMLLLDGVMITISYRSPTITIFAIAKHLVTILNASVNLLRPQELSYSKFSVKIFKFSLPWQKGLV